MAKLVTFISLVHFSLLSAQSIWVNEFHYDNIGTDTGEFVEVVVPQGTNPNDITVSLYNGSSGTSYGTNSLNTFTEGVTVDGFTIYSKLISGIQNGGPDGIALDNNGAFVQFLSYEGSFTAVDGLAIGETSVDIGVSENNSTTAPGTSLQLLGSGTDYANFTWSAGNAETRGTINSDGFADQSLPVELIAFKAINGDRKVILQWSTASEINNQGFSILRSFTKDENYLQIDSYETNRDLKGKGTSSSQNDYSYIDDDVVNGNTYWYKLLDIDLSGVHTEHGPISATLQSADIENKIELMPAEYELYQNIPNPFNPSTSISFDIPDINGAPTQVNLTVYNLLGQKLITLIDGFRKPGIHTEKWNGLDQNGKRLASGIYIYQIITENFSESKKMTLIK